MSCRTILAPLLSAALCFVPGDALRAQPERPGGRGAGGRDLVLMHVPYNFGHTVEMEALLPFIPNFNKGVNGKDKTASGFTMMNVTWPMVQAWKFLKGPGAEVWGHFHPDLQGINKVSGCPNYFTPPKHWPKELAEKYFGNRTIFGMLRDPYERLNSIFRGGFSDYGGSYPEFFKTCDVNGAVKQMMKEYIDKNDHFHAGCTFLPQAEYFDGEYGIKLPIDNRRFPSHLNEVFKEHGYKFKINTNNVAHVRGCDSTWSGDFDAETRALVKQVYKRDFELLCKTFNYCDDEESVCIPEVPYMCPVNLFEWDSKALRYYRKDSSTTK